MLIRFLLLPSLFLSVVSCAAPQVEPPASEDFKDFRQEFALENRRLHEKMKFTSGFSFMSFNLDAYKKQMKIQNEKLYNEIETYDEVIIGTSPSAFVVCVKSASRHIAICDNSGTAVVDRIKVTNPLPDLKKLMDEIRGP